MECPQCNKAFHPQMQNVYLGMDYKSKTQYSLYYQLCPSCKKPIVGIHSNSSNEPTYIDQNELDTKLRLLK